jgi:hypothetical protein
MVVVYAFTVQGAPFLSRLPCDLAHQMTGMFPYGGRESGTRMVYSVVGVVGAVRLQAVENLSELYITVLD